MKNKQWKNTLLLGFSGLLLWVTAFAQSKKETLDNGWEVNYTANNQDLNGPYTINAAEKVIMRGSFADNQPKGNWFAFSKSGDVAVRYNFDNNQVLQMDQELITKADINILSNDKQIKEEARIPFPLISTDYYIDYLQTLVKQTIPSHVKQSAVKIPTEVIARIDENGEVSYQAKYIAGNREYQPKLKIKEDALRINWVPAEYDDKKYASEFTVYFELALEDAPGHRRVIWN